MNSILLVSLFSVAFAAPQFQDEFRFDNEPVAILEQRSTAPVGAIYDFLFRTADGVYREERGEEGFDGTAIQTGAFTFADELGNEYTVEYRADENGFQPQGAHLPVGPEIPFHAQEQIRRAEEERAAGITHDGFWDPIRYGGK